jgi:hypothetical protein
VVVEAIRTVSQEVDTYPYLFKGDYGLRRLFGLEVAGLFALPGMLEEARYHIRCMRAKHADTVSNWRLDMDRHCARLASKEHFNLLKQFELHCWYDEDLEVERREEEKRAVDVIQCYKWSKPWDWCVRYGGVQEFVHIPVRSLKELRRKHELLI